MTGKLNGVRRALYRRGVESAAFALFTAIPFASNPSAAAEMRVLSAAAVQSVLGEIASDFERATGHRIVLVYRTMGAITERMLGGETADLVISSGPSIAALAKAGKIERGSEVAIAKVGVGVVVRTGDWHPRIANGEDLRTALIEAACVIYANPRGGGAAGIHVARLVERMGLAATLEAKTVLAAGGDVAEVMLAHGPRTIGLTQVSEIVGKPGLTLVGALPEDMQNYTYVVGGIPVGAQNVTAVRAFIAFLVTPSSIAAFKAKGLQPSQGGAR